MMTITIDTREFNAGLRRAIHESSRAAEDVVNGKAYAVAAYAAVETMKADREAIARSLGKTGNKQVRDRKTGMIKQGRNVYGDISKAKAIEIGLRRAHGLPLVFGKDLDAAARKLIASKLRSVGFIASGWIWAARRLGKLVKKKWVRLPGKIFLNANAKGDAVPARPGLFGSGSFVARIENSALVASGGRQQMPGKSGHPERVAASGLEKAIAIELQNMERHSRERFTQGMKSAGVM